MRFYSLLMLLVPLACSTVGCNQSEPEKTTALTTNKPPASRATEPDDARDSNGPLVAISLRGQDMTLADLANSENVKSLERIDAHSAGLTETDMVALAKFSNLKKLEMNVNTKITDESLRHLKALEELRILSLFFCPQLTGSGFEHLTELDKLANLNIGNNKNITDESLLHLRQLESLQILLASPLHGITDAGVKHVSEFSNLRRLRLSGDQITDAGLEHLTSLKNLEVLTLSRSHSEAAIAKLQQALPNCTIQQ